jgi:DNA/RNA endonuclease G (NUC1)
MTILDKMKQLLFLIVLLPTLVYSQRAKVIVKSEIFNCVYSEVLQQPLEVTYTVACTNGTALRTGLDFYICDSVKTSDNADYANNEYDKGHCAPAAAFNCTPAQLKKTFSYLNCVLQQENLNRGAWRLLEAHERELAKTSKVSVKIVCVFSATSKKLPTGATVPDAFYKYIYVNGKPTECYYFLNVRPASTDYTKYKIACK